LIGVRDSFSNRFLIEMKSEKNLEDIFLKAQQRSESLEFPMISTPIGRTVQKPIY
jgi:hypothetical protein